MADLQSAARTAQVPQDNDLRRQPPAAYTPLTRPPADPELARVVAAWPQLPDHIKAAVLALVGAAGHC